MSQPNFLSTTPNHMSQVSTNMGVVADIVITTLKNSGVYDQMSEEQRNVYIPQFVQTGEERVGLELWGDLSKEHQEKYLVLLSNTQASPTEIASFWHTHHSSFEDRVADILRRYTSELIEAFRVTA